MTRRGAACALLGVIVLAAACADPAPPPSKTAYPPDGTIAPAPNDGRQPGALAGVVAEPVVGRVGPDGQPFEVASRTAGDGAHLTRRFGSTIMELGARTGDAALGQYPCATCHLGGGVREGVDRVADAHGNIQPEHPAETGARCVECHAPDDVERLALGTGERVTLDHAYRLCAQCHSPQVNDWAAGVHGKRLDGWQGRRVVMNCADCHDPHRPALQTRVPFPPPQIPRTGGRPR